MGRGLIRSFAACLVVVAAVASGLAGSASGAEGPEPKPWVASDTIDGIDVSHWQNTIDWSQVAAAGYRFAIMKASEGQTFDDPNYATNRAEANAAGIYIGAYHFARPDSTTNDATIEADHFTRVATPKKGDIVPVLDIEDSGGLPAADLIAWIRTWLGRVESTVGVKPMIYTGPNFWRTATGDTTEFADHGYRLVWIANWFVPKPDVPANDWGGNSWTFWQYDNCGTVPGISGCVDLDYLKRGRGKYILIP
jgi:lysozyme